MCQASRASPRECLCVDITGDPSEREETRGTVRDRILACGWPRSFSLAGVSRSRSETQEAERGPGKHLGQPRRGAERAPGPAGLGLGEPLEGAHKESAWAAWVQLSLGCLCGAGSREALILLRLLAWRGWAPAARGARSPYPWAGAGLSLCSPAFFPG